MKKRFTEEQIIGSLCEAEAGVSVKELCRRHGFSEASYDLWRSKFGGMSVPDAKRPKAMETENARLKKLLAEQMLENEVFKDVLQKNGERTGPAGAGTRHGREGTERTAGVGGRAYEHRRIPLRASARSQRRAARAHRGACPAAPALRRRDDLPEAAPEGFTRERQTRRTDLPGSQAAGAASQAQEGVGG